MVFITLVLSVPYFCDGDVEIPLHKSTSVLLHHKRGEELVLNEYDYGLLAKLTKHENVTKLKPKRFFCTNTVTDIQSGQFSLQS